MSKEQMNFKLIIFFAAAVCAIDRDILVRSNGFDLEQIGTLNCVCFKSKFFDYEIE